METRALPDFHNAIISLFLRHFRQISARWKISGQANPGYRCPNHRFNHRQFGRAKHEKPLALQLSEEHVNHAVQQLFAYLAGGESDDPLSHAILRAMFAYEVDHERERTNGYA